VAGDDGVDRSSAAAVEHAEAVDSARALVAGLVLGLMCTVMLVGAVGTTWYGPAKDKPRIAVDTEAGVRCGEVIRLRAGLLTLKTETGETEVDLRSATGMRAVDSCTPAAAP
jgi:hypothetical protein